MTFVTLPVYVKLSDKCNRQLGRLGTERTLTIVVNFQDAFQGNPIGFYSR
jgi:hypothetical protein